MRTWILASGSGLNPLPCIEPLLVWPPLVYAITYAYKESKRTRGGEDQADKMRDPN